MKVEAVDSSLYWTPAKILSYAKLFNFVVGGTGTGKTYGLKKWMMEQFIKKDEQFIYLRRYDTDFQNMDAFFSAYPQEFKKGWTANKDGTLTYQGKVAGYYYSISKLMKKGSEFPLVANVFFDEFIVHGGLQRYLPDEVDCFLGAADAICRYIRDVRFFFVANAVSMYNPYFLEWGYTYTGREFWTMKSEDGTGLANDSVVQWVKNNELAEALASTRFGRAIKGTRYGDYALYNQTLMDSADCLRKKTRYSTPVCNLRVDGQLYSVWRDEQSGEVTIAEGLALGELPLYAVTEKDKGRDAQSVRALKQGPCWGIIVRSYDYGYQYYETQKAKSAAFKLLKTGF